MKQFRTLHAFTAALALVAIAPATITSYSEYAGALAYQYDSGGLLYNFTSSAPVNFFDPYTANYQYGDSTSTYIVGVSSVTSASSSYIHAQGQFAGQSTMTYGYGGGNYPTAETYMYHEIIFTVDAPTLVTIAAFGTNAGFAGSHYTSNYLYVDSTLQDGAYDGTYSVTVGAGTHYAFYEGVTEAYYKGYGDDFGYSYLTANYDLQIGDARPVPEPTSMCAVGVGVLSLIRRKRARS
ncbi:MAG: PEP-CTERM sorting domain-containing protein [Armatimonadetes bacterium]|nr:PEP-CTERM sorting domain-containing protein [Armatimonadota bacterium]